MEAKENRTPWRARGFGLLVAFLLAAASVHAQQTADDLRSVARNPVGDAIKLPLSESFNFDAGPYHRIASSFQMLPLIPLQVADNWLLIPRIAATPLTYLPDVTQANGGTTGMADTVATIFITPAHPGWLVWGIGPSVLIPTATNSNLGGGRWDLGPSIGLVVQPKWGSAYLVAQNIWSLPGDPRRASVDQIQIETSFSVNLPQDWYLFTSPTINADWTQSGGNRWLVPFGGGIGRTFNIGRQAVDMNVSVYSNAIRPAPQLFPKWQLSLQCTLLYPRKRKPN